MFLFFRRNVFKIRPARVLVVLGLLCFMLNPIVEFFENRRVDLLPETKPGISVGEQLLEFDHQAWVELQALIIIGGPHR